MRALFRSLIPTTDEVVLPPYVGGPWPKAAENLREKIKLVRSAPSHVPSAGFIVDLDVPSFTVTEKTAKNS